MLIDSISSQNIKSFSENQKMELKERIIPNKPLKEVSPGVLRVDHWVFMWRVKLELE